MATSSPKFSARLMISNLNDEVPHLYSSMEQSVGTSMSLGVSPARTTLSEQAMHSTQSPLR